MATLDLTTARAAAETIMVDTCTITRDAQGTDDDTLNQATGALTPPVPDIITVYAGRCLVRPAENVPRSVAEGGVAITASLYEASLPYSAPVVSPGDLLAVTACVWDPALVGRAFRVRQALVTGVNIRRKVLMEDRGEGAAPAPAIVVGGYEGGY